MNDASWPELTQAVHGTTLGSNIVIERKATGVALVTTKGFRDVLVIGRQKRYQLYDLQIDRPEPLVDRASIFEVPERVLADGSVRTPLDEAAARALLGDLKGSGIRSLAVCFLHAFANPVHERRFAELAAEMTPSIHCSLSSEVSPQFREYERTSTTVVNAYLVTAVRDYLGRMLDELSRRGYRGRLFIMQSGGGTAEAETMTRFPVRMIESGPAAGALIAARYGSLSGHSDVIAFDMGGTTSKLSLVVDGSPETVDSFELHRIRGAAGSGLPMNVRAVDLVEIGAGGGSIARASRGTIQVGPDSAGSQPGPACYGRGGAEATVTDANLILGYLNPERFAGGSMRLDVTAAETAVRRVGDPLGMGVTEAAWGVHAIVNLNMELATRVVSIERGHDPRRLALVATGGCGPAHACRLAQALGLPRVMLPAAAGVASAIGLLDAQPRFDVSRTYVSNLDGVDWDHVEAIFGEMEAEARPMVEKPEAVLREVDLRYVGQGYELTVELRDQGTVRADFEAAYTKRYGFAAPGEQIEATTWRLTVLGPKTPVKLPRFEQKAGSAEPVARREAYFPECEGFAETPIFDRYSLFAGSVLEGPAIVEERESTTVLPPGTKAEVDEHGTLLASMG
jgi:N-methylhydantoinase A